MYVHFCTIDVKLKLFRGFCTSFYCCYLWTGYKKSTFNRLRVAFNNAYRRILDLPWRCSASGMYATYGIYNLEAFIRKQTIGFIERLYKNCNTLIVQTLENVWIIRNRIQLWHTWFEVLYTNRWYIWWQYPSVIFVMDLKQNSLILFYLILLQRLVTRWPNPIDVKLIGSYFVSFALTIEEIKAFSLSRSSMQICEILSAI